MRETRVSAAGLREAIDRSGYYPDLVSDAVDSALGKEAVDAYVVHHEATFDPAMEVRRHVTVLVLTPTRLLVCHTDEHPPAEGVTVAHASTTTEAVRLSRIKSVAVTRVVPDPAAYAPGVPPTEATLNIGWGGISHVDLEPATCGDENCEADHGYTGAITADDLSLRVSDAADGAEAVAHVLAFAKALSAATAHSTP
ncbi:phosphodiesterase, partial [Spongiactinospora gelatinilytica]